ncbi:MAG TPA: alpha/beta hydrolase [Acidimicrobiales bacterium]|nr:alpha/beta hydrolase [Acidimicrobiales bacterium]
MDQGTVSANGVQFTYLTDGPADGPLALCLHGFPDTAHSWRYLLPTLADAGYRAVAPWLRGYAPSEVAPDGCYQAGAIGSDACALHEALRGDSEAVLIGHDWGAAAAYSAGPFQPERWRRIVTMAVPPLAAVARGFFTYAQLKRSFYVFVFQTPLAEAAVAADEYSFIDKLWADWSPGYDSAWDVSKVKESIGKPENLTAAIGYYRAMFDSSAHDPRYAEAQAAAASAPPQPTLYMHGAQDGCMALEVVGDVLPYLSEGSEQVTVPSAGHFLHLEQPDLVAERVLRFLAS